MEVTFWAILLKLRVHTLLSALNATRCAVSSRSVVSNSETPWTAARQAPLSMGILQARVGRHDLLQGIFPTQGLKPGLLHVGKFFTI